MAPEKYGKDSKKSSDNKRNDSHKKKTQQKEIDVEKWRAYHKSIGKFVCPYNYNHICDIAKEAIHLAKCPHKYKSRLEICPNDRTHRIHKHEMKKHIEECSREMQRRNYNSSQSDQNSSECVWNDEDDGRSTGASAFATDSRSQSWHNNETGARRKEYKNKKPISDSDENYPHAGYESTNGEWNIQGVSEENWDIGLNLTQDTEQAYKPKAASKYNEFTDWHDDAEPEDFRRSYSTNNEEERNICTKDSFMGPRVENLSMQSAQNFDAARDWNNMEDGNSSRLLQSFEELAESLPQHNERERGKDYRNNKKYFSSKNSYANETESRDRRDWKINEESVSGEDWETGLNLAKDLDQSYRHKSDCTKSSKANKYDLKAENFDQQYSDFNEEGSNFGIDDASCTELRSENSPSHSIEHSNDARFGNIDSNCTKVEKRPTYSEVVSRSVSSEKYPYANGNDLRNGKERKTYKEAEKDNCENGLNMAQSTDLSHEHKASNFQSSTKEYFSGIYSNSNEGKEINELSWDVEEDLTLDLEVPLENDVQNTSSKPLKGNGVHKSVNGNSNVPASSHHSPIRNLSSLDVPVRDHLECKPAKCKKRKNKKNSNSRPTTACSVESSTGEASIEIKPEEFEYSNCILNEQPMDHESERWTKVKNKKRSKKDNGSNEVTSEASAKAPYSSF